MEVKTTKQVMLLIVGVITAAAILFQSFSNGFVPQVAVEHNITDSDAPAPGNDVIIAASPSFYTPAFHLELTPEVFCLYQILFEGEEQKSIYSEITPIVDKAVSLLIGIVISPNAP